MQGYVEDLQIVIKSNYRRKTFHRTNQAEQTKTDPSYSCNFRRDILKFYTIFMVFWNSLLCKTFVTVFVKPRALLDLVSINLKSCLVSMNSLYFKHALPYDITCWSQQSQELQVQQQEFGKSDFLNFMKQAFSSILLWEVILEDAVFRKKQKS